MSPITRRVVLLLSAPVIAFALVGGVLGKTMVKQETYQHLKVFDDVVELITKNYVEKTGRRTVTTSDGRATLGNR